MHMLQSSGYTLSAWYIYFSLIYTIPHKNPWVFSRCAHPRNKKSCFSSLFDSHPPDYPVTRLKKLRPKIFHETFGQKTHQLSFKGKNCFVCDHDKQWTKKSPRNSCHKHSPEGELKIKQRWTLFYSIGPKIGTSVLHHPWNQLSMTLLWSAEEQQIHWHFITLPNWFAITEVAFTIVRVVRKLTISSCAGVDRRLYIRILLQCCQ